MRWSRDVRSSPGSDRSLCSLLDQNYTDENEEEASNPQRGVLLLLRVRAAVHGRFCCRSRLSIPTNSDSVALMLTLAGADDDGAAEPGPRTVSLLLQS